MKPYQLLFSLIAIVCFTACNSNPLKPDDAKEQIIKHYESRPSDLVGSTSFEAVIRGKDSGHNSIMFREYFPAGLLKIKGTDLNAKGDTIYMLDITEKGNAYKIKEFLGDSDYPYLVVKTFDYYVSDITNIKFAR